MTTLEKKQLDAFASTDLLPELFHAVTHNHEILRAEPYDVESIHAEAREVFANQLARVSGPNALCGRIMLIRGGSGSGKTHLMRVFRNQTHQSFEGYFSYMQMTSHVNNFSRYMLRQTLDSLDKPYYEPAGPTTGLMRLSNLLAEGSGLLFSKQLDDLRASTDDPSLIIELIYELADRIVCFTSQRGFEDVNLVRALLFLQQRNPALNNRVFQYLRCERLTPFDSNALGGLANAGDEDEPLERLRSIARMIRALEGGALIVCLDQLEDLFASEGVALQEEGDRFRNAMRAAISLAEQPNVLVIVACLTEFYEQLAGRLLPPHRERIQRDPAPIDLNAALSYPLVRQLVERRMKCLYAEAGLNAEELDVLYPFSEEQLRKYANQRSRDVLSWCREQRQHFQKTREFPKPQTSVPSGEIVEPALASDLERLWNDHQTNSLTPPADPGKRLTLLRDALRNCGGQLPDDWQVEVHDEGAFLEVGVASKTKEHKLLLALCEQPSQGGSLAKRLQELRRTAAGRTPFALRSSEFPSNPKTQIAKQIGEFIASGGRREQLQESDWLVMQAFDLFRKQHENRHDFAAWLRESRPVARLTAIREILNLEGLPARALSERLPVAPAIDPSRNPVGTNRTHDDVPASKVRIGVKVGLAADPYYCDPSDFLRHAAFLGGTGSGKTTLALNVLEQLLMFGVHALLIDRKGDLCCYGLNSAWENGHDPTRKRKQQAFRESIDIAVYTPGSAVGVGRPLSIGIAPNGLDQMPSAERDQLANQSATALGGLMNYGNTPADEPRVAILGRAISLLAEQSTPITIDSLLSLIDSQDPLLINAIGRLDPKHFKNLVERLQTLQYRRGHLFAEGNELLNAETLFAAQPGKRARLSIINTSFLQDAGIYWVAQLLLEIGRYTVRYPQKALQAALLFDEADMYLPAQSKPATKLPMESLLKRARSAGLSVMLATQSPGDLDYKSREQINSWFVGKITQPTAIKKLEPLFQDAKIDPSGRLAAQKVGQFFMLNGGSVFQIQSDLSLMVTQQLAQEDILAAAQSTLHRETSVALV
jgi:DNA helicase HerA-like ATPase